MRKSRKIWLIVGSIVLLAGIIGGGRFLLERRLAPVVAVTVPTLSPKASIGEAVFVANCASCHGKNAAGSDKGPPLVDQIYRPSHHGDFSFVRAVSLGVPQHHWLFGPMPALPQVTGEQIEQVVFYIRELQQANGIR